MGNEREQSPGGAEDYRQGLSEAQPLITNTHKQTPMG
jgi:hypothetical protein